MSKLSMDLPTEIVERAVRDKINAAIASQLGDPAVLIEKLVANALAQKVNDNGNVSRSSYENRTPFLEYVAGDFIRNAAKEALKEFFAENKDQIKEAVKKEVIGSSSKLAEVFVAGLLGSMEASYYSKINISFQSRED
jgi:hypothetical protein